MARRASEPAVSVVIAAYGRSNVLPCALETVAWQTFDDFEVIVVDDASPDDTSEVVERFGDPRMRAVRLARNVGEQSGPNNAGVLLAAAPLIAFLNQDDLWFPDHLAHLVDLKGRRDVGIVVSTIARAWPPPTTDDEPTSTFKLVGPGTRYDPKLDYPASGWLLDRSLHLALGGWKPAGQCYGPSSQEFLFRAWRSGAGVGASGHLTVLAEGSGNRPGSYRGRQRSWHEHTMEKLTADPDAYREEILVQTTPKRPPATARVRAMRKLERMRNTVLVHLGVSPSEWRYRRQGRGRGGYLASLRRIRGLDGD